MKGLNNMRIAVICETSAADRNKDIIKALGGYGHEIFNMKHYTRQGERQHD